MTLRFKGEDGQETELKSVVVHARMIYVVQGSTGEYSDHDEWLVKAFARREDAEALVMRASAKARELQQWARDDDGCDWYDEEKRPKNDIDPALFEHGSPWGGGWNYCVLEVELIDEPGVG